MPQILSPGVYITEGEVAGYIPAVSTAVGAWVGFFNWGPVFDITSLSQKGQLVDIFGKPGLDDDTGISFYMASNFLDYSTNLRIVRVADEATANNSTASGTGIWIKNETHYTETYKDGSGAVGLWAAKYPGALGNSIDVSSCSPGPGFNAAMNATVTSNASSAVLSFSGNTWLDTSRPLQVGDLLRINNVGEWLEVIAINNFGNTVTVSDASDVTTAVANTVIGRWKYADFFDSEPNTSERVQQAGGANDEIHVIVLDRYAKFTQRANTVLERFGFMSVASDARAEDGTSNYYVNKLAAQSRYIWWMDHNSSGTNWGNTANGTTFTQVNKPNYSSLSGGTDGLHQAGDLMTGYDLFLDKESVDISLVITGDHPNQVKIHVLDSVVGTRKDCVAFIGPRKDSVVLNPTDEPEDVQTDRAVFGASSYGFFVDNWKYQYDQYNDIFRWFPIDADIAGLAARTDQERDAWWSFAGLNRGQIKNVTKLAWKATQANRDDMYKKGINSVIAFEGEGPILYGDRTMLLKPSAFDRINVRRLFLVLEKAIALAARYQLFEFNDAFTRAQFVNMVEPYLRDVMGRRGITAFKVIADETNNTPVVIQRNEFVGDIFIVPNYSINGIQLNFTAVGPTVKFEEVIVPVSNF